MLAGCQIVIDDPAGKECDDSHPCRVTERCVDNHCELKPGSGGGGQSTGGSGGSGGVGGVAGVDAGSDAGADGGDDFDGGSFYIDPVNGADSRDGLSPTNAWRTIGRAAGNVLPAGAKIHLLGGERFTTPTIQLDPKFSGAPGRYITWTSYGGDGGRPILDGAQGLEPVVRFDAVGWHRLQGFRIRNSQHAGIFLAAVNDIVLDDVVIEECASGIVTHSSLPARNVQISRITASNMRLSPALSTSRHLLLNFNSSEFIVDGFSGLGADGPCILDQGIHNIFRNVSVGECGALSAQPAVWARGVDSRYSNLVVQGSSGDCLFIQTDGGVTVENANLSGCATGVNVATNVRGPLNFVRSVVHNTANVFRMQPAPALGAVNIVHNTFIAGLADGGASTSSVVLRSGSHLSFQNNVIAGAHTGQMLTATPPWSGGFIESGNAYETDGSAQFAWSTTTGSYAAFVTTSGTAGGSTEAAPGQVDATGRLKATSSFRDRGVTVTGYGALEPGCDGGLMNYCGSAPEPGAFELLP